MEGKQPCTVVRMGDGTMGEGVVVAMFVKMVIVSVAETVAKLLMVFVVVHWSAVLVSAQVEYVQTQGVRV